LRKINAIDDFYGANFILLLIACCVTLFNVRRSVEQAASNELCDSAKSLQLKTQSFTTAQVPQTG
jgi:hypothetical protein